MAADLATQVGRAKSASATHAKSPTPQKRLTASALPWISWGGFLAGSLGSWVLGLESWILSLGSVLSLNESILGLGLVRRCRYCCLPPCAAACRQGKYSEGVLPKSGKGNDRGPTSFLLGYPFWDWFQNDTSGEKKTFSASRVFFSFFFFRTHPIRSVSIGVSVAGCFNPPVSRPSPAAKAAESRRPAAAAWPLRGFGRTASRRSRT